LDLETSILPVVKRFAWGGREQTYAAECYVAM
jgi:hypothetical protein